MPQFRPKTRPKIGLNHVIVCLQVDLEDEIWIKSKKYCLSEEKKGRILSFDSNPLLKEMVTNF